MRARGKPRRAAGRTLASPVVCRLRVDLPDGLFASDFTRDHPGVTLRIYDSLTLGGGLLIARVVAVGGDASTIEGEMRKHPNVHEVLRTSNGSGPDSLVVVLAEPTYLAVLQKHRILRLLPVIVAQGSASYTLIASKPRLVPFLRQLRRTVRSVEVVSIASALAGPPRPGALTRRQLEAYRLALAEGYYEVPRRISLSDLARRLGRSKASLSELLARVEAKLMRESPSNSDTQAPMR